MNTIYDLVEQEARTAWLRERPDAETGVSDVPGISNRRLEAFCLSHDIPVDPPF